MILVVGATGLLGTEICRRLQARGHPTRALVRVGSAKERFLRELGLEIVHGDLKDSQSLKSACRGIETVITTANAISSRRAGDSLETVDRNGALALLDAAKSAGSKHFIYTSISPSLPANNTFVRYKREVERAVHSSGLQWTILQPSAFMEIHAGPIGGWDFVKGRARVMGSGRVPVCYISLTDVAALAAASVTEQRAINQYHHVTGTDRCRLWMPYSRRIAAGPLRVQKAPIAVLRVARAVLRPFDPVLASLMGMGIGMEQGERTDMAPRLGEFGIQPRSFEQDVRGV